MTHKSRNLPLYDFLECLQQEYVAAEVRSKTYPSNNDKRYHRKVMGYKREKIEDIAQRNQLSTIFNDQTKMKNMYNSMYTHFGLPEFCYKDDSDRSKFEQNDILNYFAVGGEVKIQEESGISIGIISDNEQLEVKWQNNEDDLQNTPIAVKKRNESGDVVVLISQLSRIL